MKYFTALDNFDVDTIGTNAVGWTIRGGGTPTYAPAYGSAATVPYKRRYMALTTRTATTISAVSWDTIDGDANRAKFDLLTCIVFPLTTVDDNVRIFARESGGLTDAYFAIADFSGSQAILYKTVASAGTVLSVVGYSFDLTKSYFIRFRGNLTALSMRIWDAALGMAGEPTTWTTTATDSDITAAGRVGLCCLDAVGVGEVAAFNFFAVGTNGDSAVCPRTNTEYSAWLNNQGAMRAIVAKMRFTGYDAAPGSPPIYAVTRKVYLSNYGYTSAQQDTPSLQHFDDYIMAVPTFSRQMPAALTGQAQVSFGKLRIRNNRR